MIAVFNRGTGNELNGVIHIGGQEAPSSIAGLFLIEDSKGILIHF